MRWFALALLVGCGQPPSTSRAVLEVYRAPDGAMRCVDHSKKAWRAIPACCPDGFSAVGFSVASATETHSEKGVDRTLYRHVVCLQDLPTDTP